MISSFKEFEKTVVINKSSSEKGDLFTAMKKGEEGLSNQGLAWRATATSESGINWEIKQAYKSYLAQKYMMEIEQILRG
jgi:hypothetical protein